MISVKNLLLGSRVRDASDKLKDMPDDTGKNSTHLSLSSAGNLGVVKEVQVENELGEPEVQEQRDNILQASEFDTFIQKLQSGIADQKTSYSMNDIANLILELACICRGVAAISRKSCEEVAEEEEEAEPES